MRSVYFLSYAVCFLLRFVQAEVTICGPFTVHWKPTGISEGNLLLSKTQVAKPSLYSVDKDCVTYIHCRIKLLNIDLVVTMLKLDVQL